METLTFDQKLDLLRSWSKTFANKVDHELPAVTNSLDPATELPKGCPSHASLALLHLDGIREAFREVTAALAMVVEDLGGSLRPEPKPS